MGRLAHRVAARKRKERNERILWMVTDLVGVASLAALGYLFLMIGYVFSG